MKKYLVTFLVIFTSLNVFGGNPSSTSEKKSTALVSGKVIDKVSGEEIAGAEIVINDKIIYTDLDGNFSCTIDVNNTEAVIKYISYIDSKVKINPYSYNTLSIELTSK